MVTPFSCDADAGHHSESLVAEHVAMEHPVARVVGYERDLRAFARCEQYRVQPLPMRRGRPVAREDAERMSVQMDRMVPSRVVNEIQHIAAALAQDEERVEIGRAHV